MEENENLNEEVRKKLEEKICWMQRDSELTQPTLYDEINTFTKSRLLFYSLLQEEGKCLPQKEQNTLRINADTINNRFWNERRL